jgi:hypothetical protein
MLMTIRRILQGLSVVLLAVALGLAACGGSSAGTSAGFSSLSLSSADREARNAAMAELQRHFAKGPDGWTAAVMTGNAYSSDHFLRQFKELVIEKIESQELTQSDQLNGFEWNGVATFKHTVCREAGGFPTYVLDGMAEGQQAYVEKGPGRWTQWVDYTPGPLHFQKQRGRWQFRWDGTYLRGSAATPADFRAAGVR